MHRRLYKSCAAVAWICIACVVSPRPSILQDCSPGEGKMFRFATVRFVDIRRFKDTKLRRGIYGAIRRLENDDGQLRYEVALADLYIQYE